MVRLVQKQAGFTTAEIVVIVGFVAAMAFGMGKVVEQTLSVEAQDLATMQPTPCELVHSYALLGEGMALTPRNLQDIAATCTEAGQRALVKTVWSSKKHPTSTPSAPVAAVLETKTFTAKEWANVLDPKRYEHAVSIQDALPHRFSFWQYNDWYWEHTAKFAKDDPTLLANKTHATVLEQKQRTLLAGLRPSSSVAFLMMGL